MSYLLNESQSILYFAHCVAEMILIPCLKLYVISNGQETPLYVHISEMINWGENIEK